MTDIKKIEEPIELILTAVENAKSNGFQEEKYALISKIKNNEAAFKEKFEQLKELPELSFNIKPSTEPPEIDKKVFPGIEIQLNFSKGNFSRNESVKEKETKIAQFQLSKVAQFIIFVTNTLYIHICLELEMPELYLTEKPEYDLFFNFLKGLVLEKLTIINAARLISTADKKRIPDVIEHILSNNTISSLQIDSVTLSKEVKNLLVLHERLYKQTYTNFYNTLALKKKLRKKYKTEILLKESQQAAISESLCDIFSSTTMLMGSDLSFLWQRPSLQSEIKKKFTENGFMEKIIELPFVKKNKKTKNLGVFLKIEFMREILKETTFIIENYNGTRSRKLNKSINKSEEEKSFWDILQSNLYDSIKNFPIGNFEEEEAYFQGNEELMNFLYNITVILQSCFDGHFLSAYKKVQEIKKTYNYIDQLYCLTSSNLEDDSWQVLKANTIFKIPRKVSNNYIFIVNSNDRVVSKQIASKEDITVKANFSNKPPLKKTASLGDITDKMLQSTKTKNEIYLRPIENKVLSFLEKKGLINSYLINFERSITKHIALSVTTSLFRQHYKFSVNLKKLTEKYIVKYLIRNDIFLNEIEKDGYKKIGFVNLVNSLFKVLEDCYLKLEQADIDYSGSSSKTEEDMSIEKIVETLVETAMKIWTIEDNSKYSLDFLDVRKRLDSFLLYKGLKVSEEKLTLYIKILHIHLLACCCENIEKSNEFQEIIDNLNKEFKTEDEKEIFSIKLNKQRERNAARYKDCFSLSDVKSLRLYFPSYVAHHLCEKIIKEEINCGSIEHQNKNDQLYGYDKINEISNTIEISIGDAIDSWIQVNRIEEETIHSQIYHFFLIKNEEDKHKACKRKEFFLHKKDTQYEIFHWSSKENYIATISENSQKELYDFLCKEEIAASYEEALVSDEEIKKRLCKHLIDTSIVVDNNGTKIRKSNDVKNRVDFLWHSKPLSEEQNFFINQFVYLFSGIERAIMEEEKEKIAKGENVTQLARSNIEYNTELATKKITQEKGFDNNLQKGAAILDFVKQKMHELITSTNKNYDYLTPLFGFLKNEADNIELIAYGLARKYGYQINKIGSNKDLGILAEIAVKRIVEYISFDLIKQDFKSMINTITDGSKNKNFSTVTPGLFNFSQLFSTGIKIAKQINRLSLEKLVLDLKKNIYFYKTEQEIDNLCLQEIRTSIFHRTMTDNNDEFKYAYVCSIDKGNSNDPNDSDEIDIQFVRFYKMQPYKIMIEERWRFYKQSKPEQFTLFLDNFTNDVLALLSEEDLDSLMAVTNSNLYNFQFDRNAFSDLKEEEINSLSESCNMIKINNLNPSIYTLLTEGILLGENLLMGEKDSLIRMKNQSEYASSSFTGEELFSSTAFFFEENYYCDPSKSMINIDKFGYFNALPEEVIKAEENLRKIAELLKEDENEKANAEKNSLLEKLRKLILAIEKKRNYLNVAKKNYEYAKKSLSSARNSYELSTISLEKIRREEEEEEKKRILNEKNIAHIERNKLKIKLDQEKDKTAESSRKLNDIKNKLAEAEKTLEAQKNLSSAKLKKIENEINKLKKEQFFNYNSFWNDIEQGESHSKKRFFMLYGVIEFRLHYQSLQNYKKPQQPVDSSNFFIDIVNGKDKLCSGSFCFLKNGIPTYNVTLLEIVSAELKISINFLLQTCLYSLFLDDLTDSDKEKNVFLDKKREFINEYFPITGFVIDYKNFEFYLVEVSEEFKSNNSFLGFLVGKNEAGQLIIQDNNLNQIVAKTLEKWNKEKFIIFLTKVFPVNFFIFEARDKEALRKIDISPMKNLVSNFSSTQNKKIILIDCGFFEYRLIKCEKSDIKAIENFYKSRFEVGKEIIGKGFSKGLSLISTPFTFFYQPNSSKEYMRLNEIRNYSEIIDFKETELNKSKNGF